MQSDFQSRNVMEARELSDLLTQWGHEEEKARKAALRYVYNTRLIEDLYPEDVVRDADGNVVKNPGSSMKKYSSE